MHRSPTQIDSQAGAQVHAASPVPGNGRLRGSVLLVEDNRVNQEVAASMLESFGLAVSSVENGEQALAAFASARPDLILMDCQMPILDGYEATRQIRERERAAGSAPRTPIIALTGSAMPADRERCIAAGMDDYLPKPFRRSDLYATVSRWIPAERQAGSAAQQPSLPIAAEPASGVIDADAIELIVSLQKPGAPDLLARIVDMYRSRGADLVREMESAIRAGNADASRRAAHSMKSSSAQLGARVLAARSARIEEAARLGQMEKCAADAAALAGDFLAACEALDAELARRRGAAADSAGR